MFSRLALSVAHDPERSAPSSVPTTSIWTYDGTLERIHQALYQQCREQAQRKAMLTIPPSSTSQSMKSARKRGACIDPHEILRCGQEDQGQEAAYSCRHEVGLPAPRHRSSGRHSRSRRALSSWHSLCGAFPSLKMLFVDDAYKGPKFAESGCRSSPAFSSAQSVVKRSDLVAEFVVLPKRWIVERTIGWLNRCPPPG